MTDGRGAGATRYFPNVFWGANGAEFRELAEWHGVFIAITMTSLVGLIIFGMITRRKYPGEAATV